jgi:hypothetical protein
MLHGNLRAFVRAFTPQLAEYVYRSEKCSTKAVGKYVKHVLCSMRNSVSLTIFKIIKQNLILGTRFRTKQDSEELIALPNADTTCYANTT